MTKKLYRSKSDRVIAGVCGGLGEYLDVDAVFVRLVFLGLTVFGGAGILVYLLAILLVPEEGAAIPVRPHGAAEEVKEAAEKIKEAANQIQASGRLEGIIGLVVLLIGLILLIQLFAGIFQLFHLWPIALIVIGLIILIRR